MTFGNPGYDPQWHLYCFDDVQSGPETRNAPMTKTESTSSQADLLAQAQLDASAGHSAIRMGQWERAALYFRLAVDQMQDAGVLQNV